MTATFIAALIPIALLIAVGAVLRRTHLLAEAFWGQAERLSYYVLLPCLFFYGLAVARFDSVPIWDMGCVLFFSTVGVALALFLVRPLVKGSDAAFTSIFQGSIRFNNYVGVSAAAALLGANGVALAALANAVIVPTVNVLCVLVFARYGALGRISARNILKQLMLNPLVVACVLGVLFHLTGLPLPSAVDPVIKSLGQASLPLGLVCVGAALSFSAAGTWIRPLCISSLIKFGFMPVATTVACLAFGLSGPAAIAALIFQALPTASSSYIMARQLGGDAPLMAGITAAQTLVAGFALPLAVIGLQRFL
ncbi:AEC family transporter [Xylophilus sp. GW821-FHT01B05]